ncbi:hypothetical protein B296_00007796 [Ensete ventricosum]|uniref:Uncharacterized protein n=1 Tax=Ensete ventricosum TaxID=4639 RepID=A0A426Z4R7_ENSVE|nr:hypothetical protein B296_00007796 [Ensete ventricosum]
MACVNKASLYKCFTKDIIFTYKIKEFQSVFHLPSRKFKIQAIPNVFAHRKSYELSFETVLEKSIESRFST